MLQLKFCTEMRFADDGTLQLRSLAHDTTSSCATKWKIFNGKHPSDTCTLLDSITNLFVLLQLHWLYFIKDHVSCLTEFTKGTVWQAISAKGGFLLHLRKLEPVLSSELQLNCQHPAMMSHSLFGQEKKLDLTVNINHLLNGNSIVSVPEGQRVGGSKACKETRTK